MEPTSEEQRARTERYLGLLANSIPTTISGAEDDREDRQAAGTTERQSNRVAAARPGSPCKGDGFDGAEIPFAYCKAGFAVAVRRRSGGSQVLAHESSEIQVAALDLLEKCGSTADEELSQSVARYAPRSALPSAHDLTQSQPQPQ